MGTTVAVGSEGNHIQNENLCAKTGLTGRTALLPACSNVAPVRGPTGQNRAGSDCRQPAPNGDARPFAAGRPSALAESRDRGPGALPGHSRAVWPAPPGRGIPTWNRPGRPTHGGRSGDPKPVSGKALALAHDRRLRPVTWRAGQKSGPAEVALRGRRVPTAHDRTQGQTPGPALWLRVEGPAGEPAPTKDGRCDLPKSTSRRR
jgi:hypothetical protein